MAQKNFLKIHLFFTESTSPEAKKKAKVYFFYVVCLHFAFSTQISGAL